MSCFTFHGQTRRGNLSKIWVAGPLGNLPLGSVLQGYTYQSDNNTITVPFFFWVK